MAKTVFVGDLSFVILFDAPTAVLGSSVRREIGVWDCGQFLPYIPVVGGQMDLGERDARSILTYIYESSLGREVDLWEVISRNRALWWGMRKRVLAELAREACQLCIPHSLQGQRLACSDASWVYLGPSPEWHRTVTRRSENNQIMEPALVRIDHDTCAISEIVLKSPALVATV